MISSNHLPTKYSNRFEKLILVAGSLCALLIICATFTHGLQLRKEMLGDAQGQVKTVARILTQEVNRSLLRTSGLLDVVDEMSSSQSVIRSQDYCNKLEAMTRQQFLLREIAIVDHNGLIIASSNKRSIGIDVSGYDFYQVENQKRFFIGQPKAGRSFKRDALVKESSSNAIDGFITVSRPLGNKLSDLQVVAVIGADSLISDLRFLASMETNILTLYRYDGKLLATSQMEATHEKSSHPIFKDFLPNLETGKFTDTTNNNKSWLAYFATTSDFPVVVEVRLPKELVTSEWRSEMITPLSIMLATLTTLLIFTFTTRWALRQRAVLQEQTRSQAIRLGNILDTAADAIVTIDTNSIVHEYNRAAEHLFRIPAEKAIGKHASSLIANQESEAYQDLIDYYLRTGMAPVFADGQKVNTKRRDGTPMLLSYSISEVTIKEERLLTCIFRDVSKEKQANDRFKTLFQRSGQPNFLFTDGKLLDCNQAAIQLLGAENRWNLLGKKIGDLTVKELNGIKLENMLDNVLENVRNHGTYRVHWVAISLDGREIPLEITITPIYLDNAKALLLNCSDITEQQRYEAELRQARDVAETATKAKSRFLAVMSHELRTPMTGIIGMIELLSEAQLPSSQQRQVETLDKSAKALMLVLNDILDFSKIEAGRLELEQINFDLMQMIQDVIEVFEPKAKQRHNILRAEFGNAQLPSLYGDPTRVQQVLFNLLGNAIKFTENGSVVIHVAMDSPKEDGQVDLSIEVRDTGIGIKPELQNNLFQPFQQADTSTTRRFGGTGLGLAICKYLVDAMHGQISVVSEEGKGSVFRVVLPLALAKDHTESNLAQSLPVKSSRLKSLHILVAEDTPTNCLLIEARLSSAGHRLEIVNDGQQALSAATAKDFDLILMDLQMPVLDGLGATRAIRALPDTKRSQVPIIALTADALPELREEYMASGLNDYHIKPIDWDALNAKILRHLPWAAIDALAPLTSSPVDDNESVN